MSLKKRLIMTNAAMVIIPVLITIVASFAFFMVTINFSGNSFDIKSINNMAETKYHLNQIGSSMLKENPDKLLDKGYQQQISSVLEEADTCIVVLKNQSVVFSTISLNRIEIEKCLETGDNVITNNLLNIKGSSYIVKAYNVLIGGEQGNIILLASIGKNGTVTNDFLKFIIIIFILTFIVTNIVMSLRNTKKILKPMANLQKASDEISCGNLNYEVAEEGDEEFRKLCRSFEQMRLKLKESVVTQIKLDDNRKMLVSSISHDLKTPITSIKGYVEGIMDGVANTPDKMDKYLKTIYSKAIYLDAMIDDLLTYSKLDMNQIPFNFEQTEILKFFQDCVTEFEYELSKSNIKIGVDNQAEGQISIMIDRDRMKRVIMNIIDNARKYMNKESGYVNIIIRETRNSIVIELRDNGSGIPQNDLQYIFDRFYRSDKARSKMGGSGLGLAIARQIVEGHGGRIWARSTENEGTSIIISLKK